MTMSKCIQTVFPSLLCSLTAAKGQTISKGNRGVLNSSEKRTKNYYPEYFLKRGCSEEKIFVGFFWKES